MASPWKLEDWNDIIRRVNDLSENPDDGCDPLPPLPEVSAPHRWAKSDIEQVRDRLKEICDENSFNAELRLWAQDVIDEIEDAISNGWCNCEDCDFEQRNIILRENEITVIRRDLECVGFPPAFGTAVPLFGDAPPPTAASYDFLAAAAAAITGKPRQRGGVSLIYSETNSSGVPIYSIGIGSATFHCDGSLKNLQRASNLGPVGSGPWDFSGILTFDTYSWRRAGELFCPFFFFFVDYYYTYCQGGSCETINSTPRYHAQAIGLGSIPSAPPTPRPPPDWQSGTAGHIAAMVAQDAAAAAAIGRRQIWRAVVTNFAGCHTCCPDGKGFAGTDCPFPDED